MPFSKIPFDLKERRQWALSGPDKAPLSTDGKITFNISVLDTSKLLTFDEVISYAKFFKLDFGYVLSKDDPFTCIDLDVVNEESQSRKGQPIDQTKWTTPEQFNRYWSIVQELKSYTEYSKYGKGIHVWVKGNIGSGVRRDGVEIYSQERYMICTGNTLLNLPISDKQLHLENMRDQMQPVSNKLELQEEDQEFEDWEIVDRGLEASNGDKFLKLGNGDWSEYPSQSEADMAFMSMLTFYSKSNEQCRRLFRFSKLGEREKAIRDNKYLDNTLRVIRSREKREQVVNLDQITKASALVREIQSFNEPKQFMHSEANTDDKIYDKPVAVKFTEAMPQPVHIDEGIEWPPGFVGQLAWYIYNSAPRPVKEVAIVAAIGLMAGICGKGWTITQSGLNMYIILVARSGVGKEALHSGVSSLIRAASVREPACMQFVDFSDMASGQALKKAIAENPCFLNIEGELGQKLERLSKNDGRDAAMASLRRAMTDLYQKSGPQSIVGGLKYSNKAENVASVNGAAFSLIGETTPETFYNCLTPSMMSDGFLSRFNIIEYNGKRPPLNKNQIREPEKPLADYLAEICTQAISLINRSETTTVQRNSRVSEIYGDFEKEADDHINGSEDESFRQMWNRAGLKVIKFAALLAVGDNYMFPVINEEHIQWALSVVRKDISVFQNKIETGDIGTSDFSREKKVISIFKEYIKKEPSPGYDVDKKMWKQGLISRKYLQARISNLSSFNKHQFGTSRCLDLTLKSLIDNGNICETPIVESVNAYSFHGKVYRILELNNK